MNLTNLLIKSFCLCPLICSFLTLQYTLFGFQWTYCRFSRLVGSNLDSLSNVPRSYMRCIEALRFAPATFVAWWAQVDSNHRPRAYQARALTTWAMSPFSFFDVSLVYSRFSVFLPMVEMMGIEPMTPCLQGRCSPSWATPPFDEVFILATFRSLKIEQQQIHTLLSFCVLISPSVTFINCFLDLVYF